MRQGDFRTKSAQSSGLRINEQFERVRTHRSRRERLAHSGSCTTPGHCLAASERTSSSACDRRDSTSRGPAGRTFDSPEHLEHPRELVALERHAALLRAELHLGLLALEHGSQAEQLAVDAAHRPHVDRRRVVSSAEEELGRAVPHRDDDLHEGCESVSESSLRADEREQESEHAPCRSCTDSGEALDTALRGRGRQS